HAALRPPPPPAAPARLAASQRPAVPPPVSGHTERCARWSRPVAPQLSRQPGGPDAPSARRGGLLGSLTEAGGQTARSGLRAPPPPPPPVPSSSALPQTGARHRSCASPPGARPEETFCHPPHAPPDARSQPGPTAAASGTSSGPPSPTEGETRDAP